MIEVTVRISANHKKRLLAYVDRLTRESRKNGAKAKKRMSHAERQKEYQHATFNPTITSRIEAKEAGEQTYLSATECPFCGTPAKRVIDDNCPRCVPFQYPLGFTNGTLHRLQHSAEWTTDSTDAWDSIVVDYLGVWRFVRMDGEPC